MGLLILPEGLEPISSRSQLEPNWNLKNGDFLYLDLLKGLHGGQRIYELPPPKKKMNENSAPEKGPPVLQGNESASNHQFLGDMLVLRKVISIHFEHQRNLNLIKHK